MQYDTERLVQVSVIAVLLVASVGMVTPVVAQPVIGVGNVSLERVETAVEEPVNVSATVRNSGTDGATTIEVTADGWNFVEERVQIGGESTKRVSVPFTVSEPGRYAIRVNDRSAGLLTVVPARVANRTDRDDGQTVVLHGYADDERDEVTATLPREGGQSATVRNATFRSDGGRFNATVETYVPTSAAPFDVPAGYDESLLGAVRTSGDNGVATTSLTVAVDRDALAESNVSAERLTIYRGVDDEYRPLETRRVSGDEDVLVYEATVGNGSRFLVGEVPPQFELREWNLSAEDAEDGQRVRLEATVANVGIGTADYEARMGVGGETVSTKTVSVASGENATVELEHVVTSTGTHEVTLGNRSIGSVVVAGGSESRVVTEANETESAGGGTAPDGDSLGSLDDAFGGGLGATDVGVGAGVAVLCGLLLVAVRE